MSSKKTEANGCKRTVRGRNGRTALSLAAGVTTTLQLSPISENRFLNLEFCRRKTVICRFRPSKQQQFAAIADRSTAPSGRCAKRSIAHKSENQNWLKGTPRHVLHCAPISRSKVKVTRSHRLYVSSLPLLYLCHSLEAGGGIPCRPNQAATLLCLT